MSNAQLSKQEWETGASLESVTWPAVTRVQLAKFAGAVNDFNRLHMDDEFATSSGFPSAIAHGPLTLALFAQTMGKNFGPENTRGLSVRFRMPVFPGDVLTATGQVTEVVPEDGELRVHCAIEVVREDGGVVASGTGESVIAG